MENFIELIYYVPINMQRVWYFFFWIDQQWNIFEFYHATYILTSRKLISIYE